MRINHVACVSICGLKFAMQILHFEQLKNPAEWIIIQFEKNCSKSYSYQAVDVSIFNYKQLPVGSCLVYERIYPPVAMIIIIQQIINKLRSVAAFNESDFIY